MAIGGGGIGVIVIVVALLLGVDPFSGGAGGLGGLNGLDNVSLGPGSSGTELRQSCRTGADANDKQECRVVADVNSIQSYWAKQLGSQYSPATTVFFTGGLQTGCGQATSAVGPFYCPRDHRVYIDLGFFSDLQTKFGAQGGPFAEAYILAHEYGHHIQDLTGTLDRAGDRQGPPERLGPGRTTGRLLCRRVGTKRGGDRVHHQPHAGRRGRGAGRRGGGRRRSHPAGVPGQGHPETWTHGSSQQRQHWFVTGYNSGKPSACNTFTGSI